MPRVTDSKKGKPYKQLGLPRPAPYVILFHSCHSLKGLYAFLVTRCPFSAINGHEPQLSFQRVNFQTSNSFEVLALNLFLAFNLTVLIEHQCQPRNSFHKRPAGGVQLCGTCIKLAVRKAQAKIRIVEGRRRVRFCTSKSF